MKHKPRVPRPLVNTMQLATHRAGKLSTQQRAKLMTPAHAAAQALSRGQGSVEVWQQMADVLNLAEALCELRIAGNLSSTVDQAQAAMAALMARVKAGRGWTLYSAELKALRDGVWLYGVQLDHCSAGEHLQAIAMVRNRIGQALAGNAGARARVHDASGVASHALRDAAGAVVPTALTPNVEANRAPVPR